MQLAKVVGTVVATQKTESLNGIKLLIVQKLTDSQAPHGDPFVAIDATTQAGEGDLVLIEGGREAALGISESYNPADQAVIGIIDEVYTVTGKA